MTRVRIETLLGYVAKATSPPRSSHVFGAKATHFPRRSFREGIYRAVRPRVRRRAEPDNRNWARSRRSGHAPSSLPGYSRRGHGVRRARVIACFTRIGFCSDRISPRMSAEERRTGLTSRQPFFGGGGKDRS